MRHHRSIYALQSDASRALATPFDGPIVVMTHRAPSPQSLGTLHNPGSLDPCCANRLDDLVGCSGAALRSRGHTRDLLWRERYSLAFTAIPGGHAVTGVFYDAANLPKRP